MQKYTFAIRIEVFVGALPHKAGSDYRKSDPMVADILEAQSNAHKIYKNQNF